MQSLNQLVTGLATYLCSVTDEFCESHIISIKKGDGEMVTMERCLSLSFESSVQSLGPTLRKDRSDLQKLSSNLHRCDMACTTCFLPSHRHMK